MDKHNPLQALILMHQKKNVPWEVMCRIAIIAGSWLIQEFKLFLNQLWPCFWLFIKILSIRRIRKRHKIHCFLVIAGWEATLPSTFSHSEMSMKGSHVFFFFNPKGILRADRVPASRSRCSCVLPPPGPWESPLRLQTQSRPMQCCHLMPPSRPCTNFLFGDKRDGLTALRGPPALEPSTAHPRGEQAEPMGWFLPYKPGNQGINLEWRLRKMKLEIALSILSSWN